MLEHMMQTNNVQNLIQKAASQQATGIAAADVAGGNDQKPLLSASGHEQMEAAWWTWKHYAPTAQRYVPVIAMKTLWVKPSKW